MRVLIFSRLTGGSMVVRRCVSGIVVLVLILSISTVMKAQDVASITGVVTDQTGAVVADVQVTLKDPQTGVEYKATTNTDGSYTINQVKPGPGYQIEFEHATFKSVVVHGLYLNVDATRTQNAQLIIGGTRETVEVSAASETVTLDTTDSTIGNNFQVQFLNDLPIEDRSNPSALFVQQPGVTLDGSVTGARVDQSRVTVDGLDVNDYATGEFGAIVANAPVDSVQEFRGVAAGYLSSSAGGGGGQYELVTKSGTNSFHGALVEYYRDRTLEANSWFNNNAVPEVSRPPLVRNQFGGNLGGPIIKDKLFFFFDYNGRRDTLSNLVERLVPRDSFRGGILNYTNTSGVITPLSSAQVASMDPQGVGFNPALFDPTTGLFNTRYPHANDLAVGDKMNTAGYRFNAPFPYSENDYVQRVDFTLNSKMKLWGKGSFTRTNGTESAIQFPGDPETYPFLDQSYTWVVGHVWTLNNTMVNQASYGEVFENYNFPNTYNPEGPTQYQTFGGNGTGGAILTPPYGSAVNAQGRTYPVPVFRDDFSWDKGKHTFQFGGTFKYISPKEYSILNYNSPTIGLGGATGSLDVTTPVNPLRPSDLAGGDYTPEYDSAFALALAPYTAVGATFNYNAQEVALPQGSGLTHNYRYYETELYFGDTWKVLPKLTISYGLRWQNYTVPYDTKGIESVENFNFKTYFGDRVAQSAASQLGNLAVPFIYYTTGGKANHAPGYYAPQHLNFGPRLAAAYQFDKKTVFNAGAAILYDQTVVNAAQYQQTQFSYLFQSGVTVPFGVPGDPVTSLDTDLRFSGLSVPPPTPAAPTITTPFYPYVSGSGSSAVPTGLANGQAFNEIIDPQLKNPYYIQYNVGFEREIHGGFILRASYVGRLGRRLLAQADANQLIDFRDPASGQLMSQAFANITQQMRAGGDPTNPVPQAWYEHVLLPGTGATFGLPSNTALVTAAFQTLVARGDFADTTQGLSFYNAYFLQNYGLNIGLPANVGMGSQFSENTFYTNKGFSAYNGLLATLHKNIGYGLQFDLNYTWSHSIDNVSLIANAAAFGGYGFICDILRPRECRGNSDFNVNQYFNGNFIYDLPVGKGKMIASGAPRWLDEIVGGWSVSGLPYVHGGNVYFAGANAFVAGYANNAPAILVGPPSDLKIHINGGQGQPLLAYSNPSQANADYIGPVGFNIGSRNNLIGPSYFNMDMGLAKGFPVTEQVIVKFRADAFNVFNHPDFNAPCTDITNSGGCQFGTITGTANGARVLQGSLRVEF
jgi:hypothetical protein